MKKIAMVTLCVSLMTYPAYSQQFKVSTELKKYSETDDTPSLVERYKDKDGHKYIIYNTGRLVEDEDGNSTLKDALENAFEGLGEPTITKDGYYISTGVIPNPKTASKYYYRVFVPRLMQSFTIYSNEQDPKFKQYSEKLLQLIRGR